MTLQVFDHYSDQKKDSVTQFISDWGKKPWNDMNVPIYLSLSETEGVRSATVVVYHPRKHHIKDVDIIINSDEELQMLRETFRGIGERLFEPAAYNLEAFANGGLPKKESAYDTEWGGLVLYYWERKEFISDEN